jgi:type III restriction enzyme
VVGLSEGQRMMLRAGLTKLNKLEDEFLKVDAAKNPKMLIVCQDTMVSPFVEEFLKSEGLEDDDVVTIDSNKQGEVKDEEWQEIKKKLFDIDRYKSPKVVISVLMLREGFDVNNICVLVPLRSSQAPILLEQLVGRGLRLMWREPDYIDIKRDDRLRVLKMHQSPRTYIDTLSIVEHPAFIKFYDDLQKQGLVAVSLFCILYIATANCSTMCWVTIPSFANNIFQSFSWKGLNGAAKSFVRIYQSITCTV